MSKFILPIILIFGVVRLHAHTGIDHEDAPLVLNDKLARKKIVCKKEITSQLYDNSLSISREHLLEKLSYLEEKGFFTSVSKVLNMNLWFIRFVSLEKFEELKKYHHFDLQVHIFLQAFRNQVKYFANFLEMDQVTGDNIIPLSALTLVWSATPLTMNFLDNLSQMYLGGQLEKMIRAHPHSGENLHTLITLFSARDELMRFNFSHQSKKPISFSSLRVRQILSSMQQGIESETIPASSAKSLLYSKIENVVLSAKSSLLKGKKEDPSPLYFELSTQ